ncbi:cyanophycinase [Spongiimicrobium salis]|uniref:cyanophycinase n=1 Tax=Spongiimicrobium salis TaxID=1667022 RepID=UPI00374DDFB2
MWRAISFKVIFLILGILACIALFSYSNAPNLEQSATTGPENGSLVIVGGGAMPSTIPEKFIELAGGYDAPIVVIPTAGGRNSYSQDAGGAGRLRSMGATNVTVIHTNDKNVANSDAFIAPLKKAKGVWFSGGRQWRLVDSYKNTKTEKLIWEVLDRGGVVGGSSAGASIQGSYLARGDTKNNQIMMGDHEEGFGYIKNIAIDQHVLARNRHFDMFNILKKKPELLGVSIDEGTALIVKGNTFEVLGKGYALIYDGSFWSREGSSLKDLPQENLFYFLREGDQYHLTERKVITNR